MRCHRMLKNLISQWETLQIHTTPPTHTPLNFRAKLKVNEKGFCLMKWQFLQVHEDRFSDLAIFKSLLSLMHKSLLIASKTPILSLMQLGRINEIEPTDAQTSSQYEKVAKCNLKSNQVH